TYSNSPHLYTELDIPNDVRGTVGTPRKSQAKRTPPGQRNGDQSGPRPRKSSRQRQRTRGGKSATGHPVAGSATNGEEASTTATRSADTTESTSDDGAHTGRGHRRRRRSRNSASVAAN
ncbi:MAG: ATP-dependent helicase, partial [Mycobacterium sp.]|nr:ATP-dependent helicase [Mycobacterium sp.]